MVFVKVRETYDLHTIQDKMSIIGIHTPNSQIIKANYPGLLMQCRAYRPYSCDVKIACASVLPLDPLGVGTSEGAVSPEDIFNPILYKALSNKGMSMMEARIAAMSNYDPTNITVQGQSSEVVNADLLNSATPIDQFKIYYGLLSNSHGWKHANPQSGLSMTGLKPYVYEINVNIGDESANGNNSVMPTPPGYPASSNSKSPMTYRSIIGKAKEFPYLNCTSFTRTTSVAGSEREAGFQNGNLLNAEQDVPWMPVYVAGIIIPPSRLHQLFYRMVVEWTIEFTMIRPLGEITDFVGLKTLSDYTHFQSYSYSSAKEAITGDPDTVMDNDTSMVSTNVDIKKVM